MDLENMADNAALAEGFASPEQGNAPVEETPAGADNADNLTKGMSERINAVRREMEERHRAEMGAALRDLDSFAQKYGHPSWSAMQSFVAEQELARQNEAFNQAGIDPQLIESLVEKRIQSDPMIQQAKEAAERFQRERNQQIAEGQIREIGKIDPNVKSFDDLMKSDCYPAVRDLVINKGYGIDDAYKLVNFENLMSGRAAAGGQKALNQIGGKSHMQALKGGAAANEAVVPDEIMEQYRALNKGATDEEIRKHYAQSMKG